jgi:hypothetical protein
MSEYQYYEFLALDRRLNNEEMREIRSVSSRAEITPTSFVNEYNYGDFKGDEYEFLEHFFDVHVYVANWGTHRFMLRIPKALLTAKEAKPYCGEYGFTVREAGDSLILDFTSNDDEGGDWEEGGGWMASLAPVRGELMRGDRRTLYFGWLLRVQEGEVDEDATEPPVPAGLGKLSAPLTRLAEFLRIDEDLLAVAAERSGAEPARDEGVAVWITALPVEEKDQLLLEAIEGGDLDLGSKLLARYRASRRGKGNESARAGEAGRAVGELLEAADRVREQREREEAEHKAAERARKQAAAAKARAKYLDELATRQEATWKRAEALIEEKKAKAYAEAVSLLIDLRDVAERGKATARFRAQLAKLLGRYTTRRALLDRVTRSGLIDSLPGRGR